MIDITSVLDVRFKNRMYNSSSSLMENLLCEAIVEARYQPNITENSENDSETQMPQESESQIKATHGQTLILLSGYCIIGPRPCTSRDNNTQNVFL